MLFPLVIRPSHHSAISFATAQDPHPPESRCAIDRPVRGGLGLTSQAGDLGPGRIPVPVIPTTVADDGVVNTAPTVHNKSRARTKIPSSRRHVSVRG